MQSFQLPTDEEQATSDATRERQRTREEGQREGLAVRESHILKKSRDSYMLIPQQKTRLTLGDVINFLKNF